MPKFHQGLNRFHVSILMPHPLCSGTPGVSNENNKDLYKRVHSHDEFVIKVNKLLNLINQREISNFAVGYYLDRRK